MINSPCIDLKDYIIAKDSSYIFGTNIFVYEGHLGKEGGIILRDGVSAMPDSFFALDNFKFMILASDVSATASYDFLVKVRNILQSMGSEKINTQYYTGLWATSGISYLGKTENRLSVFDIHFKGIRQPTLDDDVGNRQKL